MRALNKIFSIDKVELTNNMNNIYYINELGFSKGNHNFDLHRLPQAYIEYFPWITISWDEIDEIPKNSIIFVQTPCNNETIKLKKLLIGSNDF